VTKSQELAAVNILKACVELILQPHFSNDTVLTGAGCWLECQCQSSSVDYLPSVNRLMPQNKVQILIHTERDDRCKSKPSPRNHKQVERFLKCIYIYIYISYKFVYKSIDFFLQSSWHLVRGSTPVFNISLYL